MAELTISDKDRLVEIVSRELDLHVMPESAIEPGENSLLSRGRQRAFVKVQDGCRYQCTFCIVTIARGEACRAIRGAPHSGFCSTPLSKSLTGRR